MSNDNSHQFQLNVSTINTLNIMQKKYAIFYEDKKCLLTIIVKTMNKKKCDIVQ